MFRGILTCLLLIELLGGCGKKSTSDNGLTAWDESTQQCRSSAGIGYNEGVIGECGILRNADLHGLAFIGQSFRGAYFLNVIADGADFSRSDFSGAIFNNSSLKDARFNQANMSSTRFESSNLTGAEFRATYLFDPTKKLSANFSDSLITGAKISNRTVMNRNLDEVLSLGFLMDNAPTPGTSITLSSIGSDVLMGTPEGPMPTGYQARIYNDLVELSKLPINSTNKFFLKAFGGPTSTAVMGYLNDRISNIYYDKTEPEAVDQDINAYNVDTNWWRAIYLEDVRSKNVALHKQQASDPRFAIMERVIFGRRVLLDRPRRGLVGISAGYLDMRNNPMFRLGTLVHEARHSDCAVKPPVSEVYALLTAPNFTFTTLTCNHAHMVCPAGHALAGARACDQHAWGAYAMAAVFGESVYHDCPTCSEEDRQAALAKGLDSKSRILVLDSMLNGSLGDPNMDSLK